MQNRFSIILLGCILLLNISCRATRAQAELTKTFSSEKWKAGINKCEEWKKFLKDFDLIGMQKDEMVELLGTPGWNGLNDPTGPVLVDYPTIPNVAPQKLATYSWYSTTWCGNTSKDIQIWFDQKDNVKAWRISGMFIPNHWFNENMIFPVDGQYDTNKVNFGLLIKRKVGAITSDCWYLGSHGNLAKDGPLNRKLTKEEVKRLIKTWATRAEMARQSGQDELVEEALKHKRQYENELARLQEFEN